MKDPQYVANVVAHMKKHIADEDEEAIEKHLKSLSHKNIVRESSELNYPA